jgi:hypothetical protein
MNEHPAIVQRITTLEREMSETRHRLDKDSSEWQAFLISFGELKAQLAGLNGRVAGYLLAGSLLAAIVAVLAGKVAG